MDEARTSYCLTNVPIRSYSDPHFPTLGLNTERYRVSLRIQFECGKMRTRKTPNTDNFYAVFIFKSTVFSPINGRSERQTPLISGQFFYHRPNSGRGLVKNFVKDGQIIRGHFN